MKKIIMILLFFQCICAIACPVCERNQPKLLKGVVHGAGPRSTWEYSGAVFIGIITLITLYLSIKWLVKPGEKNSDHIKYSIIDPLKNSDHE